MRQLSNDWLRLLLTAFLNRAAGIFLSFIFCHASSGQVTNISGIINTYHSVIEVYAPKACVRVDNTTGISYGNLVLLIQMKGAGINTSNSSSFGDTTGLNNAGNYELATVCAVIDDTVFFFHDLLNSYTVADKVQLVKFGEYYSANVVGTVKAASWDNLTGKGGVLAIRADEDITLNASLFADSTGYKGGSFLMHSGTCSNIIPATGYVYDGNVTNANQSGSFKGEGAADVAANQDGGRGAPANGGGGGNNHNNGGGGGANLIEGGNGGGNYTTVSGACTGARQGIGGKALSSWGGTKIFPGGGGGAGHVNNNIPTHGGGNGGGIVIVIAKYIIGNSFKISANGEPGANSGSDGASGGGAGGTVIMHVLNSYTGPLTIEANGGNGGTSNNQNILNRCYGAGGGGSGGVIYFNGAVPAVTTSAAGGAAGADIGVNGCGAPVPAQAGNNGSLNAGYSYRTSAVSSNYCDELLPVKLIYFDAGLTSDKTVLLKWEIANPQDAASFTIERRISGNNWQTLSSVFADDAEYFYQFTDSSPAGGENYYRLQLRAKDNTVSYSGIKRVVIKGNNIFTVYPNPAKDKIFIAGKFGLSSTMILADLTGKKIIEKRINNSLSVNEFQLPPLPAGIYLIKIDNTVEKLLIR
jgi:hypothetical protein